MPSSPLGSTHGRTTSGVACHHSPWTANTMNDVGHGMPSTPFNSTHGRTTSGLTCHHRLWTSNTIERRPTWHTIISFGKHTRSKDIWRGMTSSSLKNTNGRTTSGMTCHHRLWTANTIKRCRVWPYITALGLQAWSDDIGRGMTSSPLDSTHGRMTSGEACHHRLWTAHTVGLRRVSHDVTAFRQHTRPDDDGYGLPSPPLKCTYGRMTSCVASHHRP